jgi:hypothetical protein
VWNPAWNTSELAGILQGATKGMKRRISTDQQQRFAVRLGHEQAVKRIAVMERQLLKRQLVGEIKGQELKATLLSPRNRLGGRKRHVAADWRHRSSPEP